MVGTRVAELLERRVSIKHFFCEENRKKYGGLMSCNQENRRLEVIATLALGVPSGTQVDLSIKAKSGKLHLDEWLLITIQEVSVYMDSQDEPITIFKGCRTLDLFTQNALPQFLGSSPAPAGNITKLRLALSRVALWVSQNNVLPIGCSVSPGNAIELTPNKPFVAREKEVLSLALVFDTELSLVKDESLLRIEPVIYLRRLLEN
jgi:hypothetical protein